VIKKTFVLGLVIILILTAFSACSGNSKSNPTGKYEILRNATLGSNWQMYQFRLKMEPSTQFDIDLLDLLPGDKVDGYFYMESGTTATLEISAGSDVVYRIEQPANPTPGSVLSDRFSFSVQYPLGTAYVLKFTNSGTDKDISVFLEIIYPVNAKIRGPLGIK
jgi:hypothetical protein